MEIPQRASIHYRTRFYLPVTDEGGEPEVEGLADRARSILRAWALEQFPPPPRPDRLAWASRLSCPAPPDRAGRELGRDMKQGREGKKVP